MKCKTLYLAILILPFIFTSCNKVIELKLGNDSGKLVIEGNITNTSAPQYIRLSRNVPFTSNNVYPAVSGATVTVSDSKGNNYFFTEGADGVYINNNLTGISGETYTMTVITAGITYTATSVMPPAVPLDSISSKKNDFKSNHNQREISVHFRDQPGVTNQYRFLMYVNHTQVDVIFAINDDFTDGRYVNLDLIENKTDILPGDVINVEMQCVDKPVFTYWYTLMRQQFDSPGGGVAPSNPPTNITPACLGYFSAHTTQFMTLVTK